MGKDKEHGSTRTSRPGWKEECERFIRAGVPFKVIDVSTNADHDHLVSLAAKYKWEIATAERALYIYPPALGRR